MRQMREWFNSIYGYRIIPVAVVLRSRAIFSIFCVLVIYAVLALRLIIKQLVQGIRTARFPFLECRVRVEGIA